MVPGWNVDDRRHISVKKREREREKMSRRTNFSPLLRAAAATVLLLLSSIVAVVASTGRDERPTRKSNSTRINGDRRDANQSRSSSSLGVQRARAAEIAFDYNAISRELQKYNCGPQGTFTFRLPALFEGSPTQTTSDEFVVLQESFQGKYNELATNLCDPNYRTIAGVGMEFFLDGGPAPSGTSRRRRLQQQRQQQRSRQQQQKQQGRRRLQPGVANGQITGTGSCGTSSACDSSLFRGGFGQRRTRRLLGDETEETSSSAIEKKTLRATTSKTPDLAAIPITLGDSQGRGRHLGYRYPQEDDDDSTSGDHTTTTGKDDDSSKNEGGSSKRRMSPRSSSNDDCCRSKAMMMSSSSSSSRSQPTPFQEPTEDEFEVIYNGDIRLLNQDGALRSIQYVDLGGELFCRCQAPPPPSRSKSMMSSSSSSSRRRRRRLMGTRGSGSWGEESSPEENDDWSWEQYGPHPTKGYNRHHYKHSGHKSSKKKKKHSKMHDSYSKPRYSSDESSGSNKMKKKHHSSYSSYGHSYHHASSDGDGSRSHQGGTDGSSDVDPGDGIRVIPWDEYPCGCEYRDEFFALERNLENNDNDRDDEQQSDDDDDEEDDYPRRSRCGSSSSDSNRQDGGSNQNLDYLQEVFLCPVL
jgi:hypothetical protein